MASTLAERLATIAALVAEGRETAQHPAYIHGDVTSSLLCYALVSIPEDDWQAAVKHVRETHARRPA